MKSQEPLLSHMNYFQQQNDNHQKSQSSQIKQYRIYLSEQNHANPIYLTIIKKYIIIGSKLNNQPSDIKILKQDFIGFNEEQINQKLIKLRINTFVKQKKLLRKLKRYLIHYNIFISIVDQKEQTQYLNLKSYLLLAVSNKQLVLNKNQNKFMIYFNPKSGSNSKKHFQNIIDFFAYTNFTFDILQTKRKNHCLEHLNTQINSKINQYKGIIIISGDGLIHQFVNSKVVGKIPLTHVPAGSGNAFSKYQTVLANEACEDYEAIYLAIKGNLRTMNLIEINLQCIQQPIYSFLSFEWCILADLDLNSQFLRFLSGLRFEIYALWRLIFLRKYQGKFTYSTTQVNLPPLNEPIIDNINFKTQDQTYIHKLISFIPYLTTKHQFSPLLKLEDQAMDMQTIKEKQGRWQLIKYLLNSDSGSHFDIQKKKQKQGFTFQWGKIKSFRLQPNGQDRGVFALDGERYQSQKIQARISQKKVLIFA